jgi:hypothetical protein
VHRSPVVALERAFFPRLRVHMRASKATRNPTPTEIGRKAD